VAVRDHEVDFHYVQGLGGTQLFRRGVTPVQTLSRVQFHEFFKPEVADARKA
jgi:hypothetical protein